MLQNCLNRFIGEYVAQDQVGFIPKKDPVDNIRKIPHLISHCNKTKQTALTLSVDIEKAFDSLEMPYLKTVLIFMGCGRYFLNAIDALYTNPAVILQINVLQSDEIELQRGTCQGCPLSPVLFAIGIEPLAIAIGENQDIAGIIMKNNFNTISLFADDLFIIKNLVWSLKAQDLTLKQFGAISGLLVNYSKTFF